MERLDQRVVVEGASRSTKQVKDSRLQVLRSSAQELLRELVHPGHEKAEQEEDEDEPDREFDHAAAEHGRSSHERATGFSWGSVTVASPTRHDGREGTEKWRPSPRDR